MPSVRWLAVIALVAVFLQCGVRPVHAADTARELVDRINAERIKVGLSPLVISRSLTSAAQQYASTLASGGYVGHDGSNGSTPWQRDEAAGYTGWVFLAENLAAGQTSAALVLVTWLASPVHRVNLLSPQAREVGVGFAIPADPSAGPSWVAEFGDRPGAEFLLTAATPLGTINSGLAWTATNGYQVGGAWLTFVRTHGDVDVLGLPRTGVTNDPRTGQVVQFFQRAVLERHLENPPGRQIQRRLLGDVMYPGADPPVNPNDPPTSSAEYFLLSRYAPTGLGHFVANYTRTGQPIYFQDFFDRHGGIDTFGYPKEEPKLRGGRWTQRFQAAVLEYHPENDRNSFLPGTQTPLRQYRVQLELLGDEYMKSRGIPFQ